MIGSARKMIGTFGQLDPGKGCWQFIRQQRSDLWREHCRSIIANDLSGAAATFKAMLNAWENRHSQTQEVLF